MPGQRDHDGRTAALLSLALVLAGCGLHQGYAPDIVPVYSGQDGPAAPAPRDSLFVVSWNIQYGENLDRALAELRLLAPPGGADIILLQEMDRAGAARLADSLGLNFVYAPASVHPHHQRLFGDAVLSRLPIVAHEVRVLPHPTPLTGHHRLAVAADLDLGDGARLRVVSVHTATMIVDQADRLEQAAAVFDSLAGDGPVVVAGDFNTVSPWEQTLLRRAGRAAGLDAVRLPTGPTIRSGLGRWAGAPPVLDHVFVRGLAVGSRGVARSATASDHYPVWIVAAPPR
ncbi:MAG TPA: endonuclease/exonuclease/phosphatase family protein [Candidatus Krumholzibacteria bacterium]|nr:endonuclease/exonuclease/phosphatase family protein [Candidatus Krumholzibacteria bacterium]